MSILTQTFSGYGYGGTTAKLQFFRNETFVSADGAAFIGSESFDERKNWILEIICEVAEGALTVPEISDEQLPTTTDSDNPNVTYLAVLLDSKGNPRPFIVDTFKLPVTEGGTITWNEIRTFSRASNPIGMSGYLNADLSYATFLQKRQLQSLMITLGVFMSFRNGSGEVINIPLNNDRQFEFHNANGDFFSIPLILAFP